MGGIFSMDSPLMQGLTKLLDCILLSILWLIFCIPIVTIGASTSALYYTANKAIRNNRGYIWQQFWKGFKSSFKQSTILWIVIALLMFLLYNDVKIVGIFGGDSSWVLGARVFFIAFFVVVCMAAVYIFPYVARFSASIKSVVKNCIFMMVRHLPWTILALAVAAGSLFIMWLFPIALFFMPTVGALLATCIFEQIFVRYMSEEDRMMERKLNGKEYL
ncbi:putative membrane protein YesL [Catenibacillus scindens]|uniref:Putative membrane protein YesL n=1 Tax=Catenibacillus scindens TaxID=673271 RepID=A0A7W8HAB1_9FIRM|nr:YesL family protein [Catenibacillus scindens]MBB5264585.1 putative membrane protein YesL [Catenibacillus scindens]